MPKISTLTLPLPGNALGTLQTRLARQVWGMKRAYYDENGCLRFNSDFVHLAAVYC